MLEYEKKLMLSEEEYRFLLLQAGDSPKQTVQNNFYYDTDRWEGNRQGITYRIRGKNGKWEATVKSHRTGIRGGSVEETKPAGHPFDSAAFGIGGLRMQGCLTTLRTLLVHSDGLEAVLDKNIYLDCVDYELELEYSPECDTAAEIMMEAYRRLLRKNFPRQRNGFAEDPSGSVSKSERFFARLDAISRGAGGKTDLEPMYRITEHEVLEVMQSVCHLSRSCSELLEKLEHFAQTRDEKKKREFDPDGYAELLSRAES